MKLDPLTVRLLYRLTARLDLIRRSPLRYDVDQEDLDALRHRLSELEGVLDRIRIVKVG